MRWFFLAAVQGDAFAQFNLGAMYYEGQGVERNYQEALDWFRQAADQGDQKAQVNLGVMYAQAQGVPQNYVEAYKWFSVVALDQSGVERIPGQ